MDVTASASTLASPLSPPSSKRRLRQRQASDSRGTAATWIGAVLLSAWFWDPRGTLRCRRQSSLCFVEGLDLLGGLYRTANTTKEETVRGIWGLSLDLRDMRAAQSADEKQDLYMHVRFCSSCLGRVGGTLLVPPFCFLNLLIILLLASCVCVLLLLRWFVDSFLPVRVGTLVPA
jgi:hypothetical protein